MGTPYVTGAALYLHYKCYELFKEAHRRVSTDGKI